jgi:hypothetical protein
MFYPSAKFHKQMYGPSIKAIRNALIYLIIKKYDVFTCVCLRRSLRYFSVYTLFVFFLGFKHNKTE